VKGGKFTDDLGHEFDFKKGDKFATRAATGGLSLYHYGARDEITSIWGLWSIRGSDLDVANPATGSRYPESDPNVEQVEWLATKNNLSPSCYTNPRGCFRFDNTTMVERYQNEIDYILFIDNGGDRNMKTITNLTGIPVVFIDTFYASNAECRNTSFAGGDVFSKIDASKCFGRSMLDVATKIEELAVAMEIDVDTDVVNAQKKASCDAAKLFSETMKKKQEEGLRFLTTINAVKKDDEGNDYVEIRTLDPIDLWVPRTLEELGMPLLHSDDGSLTMEDINTRVSSDEYFLDCPAGQPAESCNNNTLYPVDFWLWDSRSYINVVETGDGAFKALFPDKAIIAGQHWHYARNDGPLSHDGIARMLNEMTSRVKDAQRMHPKTDCTAIDPKAAHTAQVGGGLDRNQYICYNEELIQKEYLQCPANAVKTDVAKDDEKDAAKDDEKDGATSSAKATLLSASVFAFSLFGFIF